MTRGDVMAPNILKVKKIKNSDIQCNLDVFPRVPYRLEEKKNSFFLLKTKRGVV